MFLSQFGRDHFKSNFLKANRKIIINRYIPLFFLLPRLISTVIVKLVSIEHLQSVFRSVPMRYCMLDEFKRKRWGKFVLSMKT